MTIDKRGHIESQGALRTVIRDASLMMIAHDGVRTTGLEKLLVPTTPLMLTKPVLFRWMIVMIPVGLSVAKIR